MLGAVVQHCRRHVRGGAGGAYLSVRRRGRVTLPVKRKLVTPLRGCLAPHVPRGPRCRPLGAWLLPAPLSPSPVLRRRRGRSSMADLRFCLAGPLQLVARRNEKSSAELSRFLAKQVSERRGSRRQPLGSPPPSPRAGVAASPAEGRGRVPLPSPPRAAISSRQLWLLPTGAARRGKALRSLSVRPGYGFFPSPPLSGLCEWGALRGEFSPVPSYPFWCAS